MQANAGERRRSWLRLGYRPVIATAPTAIEERLPANGAFFSGDTSFFSLNGALYLAAREQLAKRESFYGERTYAYVMPPERSIDVDTPWDLYLCDLILRDMHGRG